MPFMLYIKNKEVVNFSTWLTFSLSTGENICLNCIQIFTFWFEEHVVKL